MAPLEGKNLCQIALVVKDIEATAREYAKLFGVKVPKITEIGLPKQAHTQFRGETTTTRAKLAVFNLGQVVLELTEADDEPSSWKTFLEEHGQGVHHIGFITEDREKAIGYFTENDMPIRHYGEYPGGNYTFMDSEKKLGVLVNLKYEPKA